MKTIKYTVTNPEKIFTITKKDVNNSQALLPNVLYKQMENFAKNIIQIQTSIPEPIPQLYKLQLLKNAHLNDKLFFNAQIKKFDDAELHLLINVKLENGTLNDTICKAIFKFNIAISQAS